MQPDKETSSAQLSVRGTVRFSLMANWSIREFTEWLSTVELAYRRLNVFLLLDVYDYYEWVTRVCSHESRVVSIHPCEEFGIRQKSRGYLENLVSVAERKTCSLYVSRIKIASLGLAEMIGNLNPLKVIADFITAWRRENTSREENRMHHKRESAAILFQILEKLHKRTEFKWAEDAQEEFVKYTMTASITAIEELARDLLLKVFLYRTLRIVSRIKGSLLCFTFSLTHTAQQISQPDLKKLRFTPHFQADYFGGIRFLKRTIR